MRDDHPTRIDRHYLIQTTHFWEIEQMSKIITALTLAATTLMLTACAYHGTWAFSGVNG